MSDTETSLWQHIDSESSNLVDTVIWWSPEWERQCLFGKINAPSWVFEYAITRHRHIRCEFYVWPIKIQTWILIAADTNLVCVIPLRVETVVPPVVWSYLILKPLPHQVKTESTDPISVSSANLSQTLFLHPYRRGCPIEVSYRKTASLLHRNIQFEVNIGHVVPRFTCRTTYQTQPVIRQIKPWTSRHPRCSCRRTVSTNNPNNRTPRWQALSVTSCNPRSTEIQSEWKGWSSD